MSGAARRRIAIGSSVALAAGLISASIASWPSENGEPDDLAVVAAPTTAEPTTTTTLPATTTTETSFPTKPPPPPVPDSSARTLCADESARDRPGGPDGFGGCWPAAATTGVPKGTTLTVVDGDLTVTTPGAVIENQDIRGCMRVEAPGVTIRRSKVSCEDFYVILRQDAEGEPLVIEDVEVTCNDTNGTGIGYSGVIVRRAHVYGCENGFDIDEEFTVTDSYIHDLYEGDEGHGDGIQLAGGANITIAHNSIIMGAVTSAIISHPDRNSNVLVTRNLLAGGAATLYCPELTSVNYQLVDNRFSRISFPTGGTFFPWTDCDKVAINQGNAWADTLRLLDP